MVGCLTDTHCHLNLNTFQEDLSTVLERAWERGVARILIPGIDLESSQKAIWIAEKDPRIFAAVGVHPSDASTWSLQTLTGLRELAAHPKVVAIGEIGLDYYRDRAPRDLQRAIFRAQLDLAAEVDKPVTIHIRDSAAGQDAWEDVWSILQDWRQTLRSSKRTIAKNPGVLHSFSGSLAAGTAAVAEGFYLGISGPVTFTNASERQALVSALSISALLLETDAPYLTPHPFRGRRNEPAYTHFIAQKIADLHQMTYEQTVAVTAANADQLFAWGA